MSVVQVYDMPSTKPRTEVVEVQEIERLSKLVHDLGQSVNDLKVENTQKLTDLSGEIRVLSTTDQRDRQEQIAAEIRIKEQLRDIRNQLGEMDKRINANSIGLTKLATIAALFGALPTIVFQVVRFFVG